MSEQKEWSESGKELLKMLFIKKEKIHTAGVPDGLIQKCSRCGEVLQDYTNAQSVGEWHPAWWNGNVYKKGSIMGTTEEVATCELKVEYPKILTEQEFRKAYLNEWVDNEKKVKFLIVARDPQVASAFVRRERMRQSEYRFVHNTMDMNGYLGVIVLFITTWKDNPNAGELRAYCENLKERGRVKIEEVEW